MRMDVLSSGIQAVRAAARYAAREAAPEAASIGCRSRSLMARAVLKPTAPIRRLGHGHVQLPVKLPDGAVRLHELQREISRLRQKWGDSAFFIPLENPIASKDLVELGTRLGGYPLWILEREVQRLQSLRRLRRAILQFYLTDGLHVGKPAADFANHRILEIYRGLEGIDRWLRAEGRVASPAAKRQVTEWLRFHQAVALYLEDHPSLGTVGPIQGLTGKGVGIMEKNCWALLDRLRASRIRISSS
ncbi:MAG: hypothetical protein HYY44_03895 [Deltaproteobacteria bacterium]|nr:hypothetical protein [Deltaproteobacteria bacterium]